MAHLTVIVGQSDIEHARLLHFAGFYLKILILGIHNALVPHPLNGDVVQVLSTLGMRIIGVPTGGNSRKRLDVVLAGAGIEDEPVAECLEECEVSIRLVGLLENVLVFHILFVGINQFLDTVVDHIHTKRVVLLHGNDLALKSYLFQSQFLDLLAVLRT